MRRRAKRAYKRAITKIPGRLGRVLIYINRLGLTPPSRRFQNQIVARMLFERDKRMPPLVDKIDVKATVEAVLGREWIIPTLYCGHELHRSRNEPGRGPTYVIKASHRSNAAHFVRRGDEVDWPRVEGLCREWTSSHYGIENQEWVYTQLDRRILVEPMIGDSVIDYKFHVFGGKIEIIQVDTDRYDNHRRIFYDVSWNKTDISFGYPMGDDLPPPPHLKEMRRAAETLGADWPFVRVDLYDIPSGPKFGELTFYPKGGIAALEPESVERKFGKLWQETARRLAAARSARHSGQA